MHGEVHISDKPHLGCLNTSIVSVPRRRFVRHCSTPNAPQHYSPPIYCRVRNKGKSHWQRTECMQGICGPHFLAALGAGRTPGCPTCAAQCSSQTYSYKPLLTSSVLRYAVQEPCGPASPLACGATCAPALPRAAAPHRRGRGLPAGAARGRAARAGRSGARSAAGARATEPGHRHPSGMFLQFNLHMTCWKSRTWHTGFL